MIKKIILNVLKGLNRRVNSVDWNNLRNVRPLSNVFGYDRGDQSIHRYYIDAFVQSNSSKVTGKCLEVGERLYSERLKENLHESWVIAYAETSEQYTFKGDLTNRGTLPASEFDCFICTQTYNFIYDFHGAIEGSYHLLKEGGYLVATVSGIQQISEFDASRWGDYWRFTEQSCKKAFGDVFGEENVQVGSFGNVLAGVASLEGLTSSELTHEELDYADPSYPLIIGIVAQRKTKD